MLNTIEELIQTEKHVVFAPACYAHGFVSSESFYDIEINEVSAWNQLEKFMASFGAERIHMMSTCDGVNCQDTCKDIETGPNTYC